MEEGEGKKAVEGGEGKRTRGGKEAEEECRVTGRGKDRRN